jgi:hypothetical protein
LQFGDSGYTKPCVLSHFLNVAAAAEHVSGSLLDTLLSALLKTVFNALLSANFRYYPYCAVFLACFKTKGI